ncbi:MAG: YicC family protein [Gammaproteobacteria bacterium]|nr:YicC family protein [Gammaproteobacteria bacterium]|tara:strand:- start:971 stop:1837 length:867 start_codon:yes stop_codon:yes gene_type:complete
MTSSMTAFTRQQSEQDWGSLTWEIRSVNHRYLETSVRLPDIFRGLENQIRERVRKSMSRGKVECQLRYNAQEGAGGSIAINEELVQQLLQANRNIQQLLGKQHPLNSMELLRWPGVIAEQQLDNDALESAALSLFRQALDDLIATREREGSDLEGFLEQRIDSIRELVATLREKMPQILIAQRQSLHDKLQDLQVELEPTRLEQEIALLAQKADVDEELDRLDSHLGEVKRILKASGQKGRRLDFLMQELNREANTLSSKSIVVESTRGAVEIKVLIEQMREQIQNIE